MIKRLVKLLAIAFLLPLVSFADVLNIKDSAPQVYVVKKGDTLWDISNMYLSKPWLWPELWRTNVHISNPHLIYPGDELRLTKNNQGDIVLDLVRDEAKVRMKLSPEGQKKIKQAQAIPALPWSVISPYITNEMIMSADSYEKNPYVLGNHEGAVRYETDNLVLGKSIDKPKGDYQIIRAQNELYDMQGKLIGLQVRHLAKAQPIKSELKKENLLKINQAVLEIKRGDRIIPYKNLNIGDITLQAAEQQNGYIIGDLEQHNLLGKYNVVILDIGSDHLDAGTVMGIYSQGPNIIDGYTPKYAGESNAIRSAFNRGDEIEQPAIKVGEVLVFKTFENASYALITESAKVIKRGMIVAKP